MGVLAMKKASNTQAHPAPYPYDVGEWVYGEKFAFEVVSCPSSWTVCSVENGTIYTTPTSLIKGSKGYVVDGRPTDRSKKSRDLAHTEWTADLARAQASSQDSDSGPDAGGGGREDPKDFVDKELAGQLSLAL